MSLANFLFGRPLASDEQKDQKIGPVPGIPIFSLDALGSAAYGPEAALTVLLPLGAAGMAYIVPITSTIIVLLAIVFFSYRRRSRHTHGAADLIRSHLRILGARWACSPVPRC